MSEQLSNGRKGLPGIRMLLKPVDWISCKVEAWTGALFHDPSSGVASSVFPKFHPGFSPANAAEAVTGVKAAVQDPAAVVVPATVEEALVLLLTCVVRVVPAEITGVVATPDPVPGTHCEYP